jgi:pimeloyl-ACP methyl ester carboxylesterase
MRTAVFVHGLNTYGDDDLHIGPLKFGSMHARLAKALAVRKVLVQSLTGLGAGSPEKQAERAVATMATIAKVEPLGELVLLGQSTGGLVARVMAAKLGGERVKAIVTWGTPHAGSLAARFGLELGEKLPALQKIFARLGYDTQAKAEIFRHFTPEAMIEFNKKYPAVNRETSLICEVAAPDLSWPLIPFYRKIHPQCEPSDGFIWSESQKRGETLGPFALDHFGELGFFPHLDPRAKARARSEFERLVDEIVKLVSK